MNLLIIGGTGSLGKALIWNLQDDYLRSEKRWERHVMSALLEADWVNQVSMLEDMWQSSHSKPTKLVNYIDPESAIGVFYNKISIASRYNFRGLFFYSGGEITDEIEQVSKDWNLIQESYQDKLIISGSFIGQPFLRERLDKLGEQFIEDLPFSLVPKVEDTDSWKNKIILWNQGDFPYVIRGHYGDMYKEVLAWLCNKLEKSPETEFHVLTYLDFLSGSSTERQLYEQMDASPFTSCLSPHKKQIKLHPAIGWRQLQELFKLTKLNISKINVLCHPVIEAGVHGIPTIVSTFESENYPLLTTKETNGSRWNSREYVEILDQLDKDYKFYNKWSEAHRNYIEENNTYRAFTDKFREVLQKRKLL